MNVVVGADPGLANGGLAALDVSKPARPKILETLHVKTKSKTPQHVRLLSLQAMVMDFVVRHQPEMAVIEKVVVGRNAKTSLLLAEARGAWLVALAAASVPIVTEVGPSELKRVVSGSGAAGKEEVMNAVAKQLPKIQNMTDHESDAVAMALCYQYLIN